MLQSSRVLDFDDNSSSNVDGTMLFVAPNTRARPFEVDTDDRTTATSASASGGGGCGADTEDSLIPRPLLPPPRTRLGTATQTSTNRSVPYFASEVLHGASHSDSSSQLPRVERAMGRHEDACAAAPPSPGLPCTPTNQLHPMTVSPPWSPSLVPAHRRDAPAEMDMAVDEESVSQELRAAAAAARRRQGGLESGGAFCVDVDALASEARDSQTNSQPESCLFSAPRNMNTPPPIAPKGKRPTRGEVDRQSGTAATNITPMEAPADEGEDGQGRFAHGTPGPTVPSRDSAGQFFRQLVLQPPAPTLGPCEPSGTGSLEDGMRTPAAPSTPTMHYLPITQTPVKQRRTVHKVGGSGGGGGRANARQAQRPSSTSGLHLQDLTGLSQGSLGGGAGGSSQAVRRRAATFLSTAPSSSARAAAHITPPVLRMSHALSPTTSHNNNNNTNNTLSGGLTGGEGGGAAKYYRREPIANGSRKRSLEVASQLDAMNFTDGVDQLTPQSYAVAQQHPANRAGFSVAHLLFPSTPTLATGTGSPSCSPVGAHANHAYNHAHALANNNNNNSSHNNNYGNSVSCDFMSSPMFSASQPVYSNMDRLSFSQGLMGAGLGSGGAGGEASQADQELSALLARRILTDFREVRELGRGSFGRVTLYEECSTHQYVAVKASMPFHDRDGQSQRYRREKAIMGMLRHVPHIVQLAAAWEDGGSSIGASGSGGGGLQQQLYLQLEYCPGGSVAALAEAMRGRGEAWDEHELRTFMVHMAIALDAMHTRQIAHVDFKPDNVLIDAAGHYKLSDFGCSVTLDEHGRPCSLRRALSAQAHGPPPNASSAERPPAPTYSPVPAFHADASAASPSSRPVTAPDETVRPTKTEDTAAGLAEEDEAVPAPPPPPTLTLAMISEWASGAQGGDANGGVSPPSVLGAPFSDFNLHRELTQTSVASVDEGDCRYLCADMLNAKQHFKAGDLFSLGMSMVELMSGCALPRNGDQFLELRAQAPRDVLLARGYSAELVDVVVQLLAANPTERPTARDLLLFLRPTADACHGVLAQSSATRNMCEHVALNGPSPQSRYLAAAMEGTLWLLQTAQDVWTTAQAPLLSPPSPRTMPSNSAASRPMPRAAPSAAGAGRAETCTPQTQMVGARRYDGAMSLGAPWPDSQ